VASGAVFVNVLGGRACGGGGVLDLAAAGRGGGGRLLDGSGGGFVGGFPDFGASTFVSESGAGGTGTWTCGWVVTSWGTYRGGGGGSAGPLGMGAGLPSNASCAATTNMGGGGTLPGFPLGGGCGWSSGTSCAGFHSFQPRVHTGAFAGMTPRASATRSSSSRTSRCWPAGSAQRHWVWLLTWKDPERCPSRVCDWGRDGEDETIDMWATCRTEHAGTFVLGRTRRSHVVNEQDRSVKRCTNAESSRDVVEASRTVELCLFVRGSYALERPRMKRRTQGPRYGTCKEGSLVEATLKKTRRMQRHGHHIGRLQSTRERLGREQRAEWSCELRHGLVLESRDRRRERSAIHEGSASIIRPIHGRRASRAQENTEAHGRVTRRTTIRCKERQQHHSLSRPRRTKGCALSFR
jgi:hypothetical protein